MKRIFDVTYPRKLGDFAFSATFWRGEKKEGAFSGRTYLKVSDASVSRFFKALVKTDIGKEA